MGYYVAKLDDEADGAREAKWFLDALADRRGSNPGPKGGLSTWGMVGNYTRGEAFVEMLRSFFFDLLSGEVDGGPSDFEHILVFEEREQSVSPTAYEISYDPPNGIVVKRHEGEHRYVLWPLVKNSCCKRKLDVADSTPQPDSVASDALPPITEGGGRSDETAPREQSPGLLSLHGQKITISGVRRRRDGTYTGRCKPGNETVFIARDVSRK